jgi:hypothetical protein
VRTCALFRLDGKEDEYSGGVESLGERGEEFL